MQWMRLETSFHQFHHPLKMRDLLGPKIRSFGLEVESKKF